MAYIQVPPDGAGKKVYTKSHTVSGNQVEGQIIHVADPTTPTQIQKIDKKGSGYIRFAEGQPPLSGFGYVKTAGQRALGVYESSTGSYDDLFSIQTAVGGVSSYDDVGHSMLLTVTGTNGSRVCRTTNRYHYYLPASANLIVMTIACGDSGKANNVRRWGAFDDNDGVYFELNGTTLYAVIRSSTSGVVEETKIPQSSWNQDKLDGTGISEYDIDLTKVNLYWIDYQWLGAGRVRFGVYAEDGSRVVAHQFMNAGALALPYMRTGTLPLRTEIVNTGTVGSSSQLREVCLAIYTEGTYEDYTFWRASDFTVENQTVSGTTDLVMAIKSKTLVEGLNHHNSIQVYPETLNVYTSAPIRIDLHQDVYLTTGTWDIGDPAASIEASSDAIVSGYDRPFHTWFFASGCHNIPLERLFEVNDEGIMLNADGTAEVWAITAKALSPQNATITVNLGYKELW